MRKKKQKKKQENRGKKRNKQKKTEKSKKKKQKKSQKFKSFEKILLFSKKKKVCKVELGKPIHNLWQLMISCDKYGT